MPPGLVIGFVVLVTSVVASKIVARATGPSGLCLGEAASRVLQTVGMGAVFFAANLATGLTLLAMVRGLTGHFVSHYALSDVSLVVLSLLQGMVFTCLYGACERARSRREPAGPSGRVE